MYVGVNVDGSDLNEIMYDKFYIVLWDIIRTDVSLVSNEVETIVDNNTWNMLADSVLEIRIQAVLWR